MRGTHEINSMALSGLVVSCVSWFIVYYYAGHPFLPSTHGLILLVQNSPTEVQNSNKIMNGHIANQKTNNEMRGTHEKNSMALSGLVVSCISWFIVYYGAGPSFLQSICCLLLQGLLIELHNGIKIINGHICKLYGLSGQWAADQPPRSVERREVPFQKLIDSLDVALRFLHGSIRRAGFGCSVLIKKYFNGSSLALGGLDLL